MRTKSSKQPQTSKSAIRLKDIEPTQNPAGGGKPKISDIPVVKTSDQPSPKLS